MKQLGFLVLAAVTAAIVGGVAAAQRDATATICKRTASKTRPYVKARANTAKLKAADIFPVPAGGCPKSVMTSTTGGQVFQVTLTGEAESPAGDPVATGTSTVRMRAGQGQVCFQLAASNLPSAAIAAHIHAGAAGVAGPVVIPLATPGSDGKSSGCSPAARPLVGKILKSPAAYYVNIHTNEFQGGAIRGQLTGTSPDSVGWVASIALKGSTEPNANGTAVVRIRKDAATVCYRLHAANITLPATAAHIHRGGPTVNGPVVVGFTAPGASGDSSGCTPATAAIIDEIMGNPANFYVNVHTTEHPAGAMRAQLG
jgi:hypothetical protein